MKKTFLITAIVVLAGIMGHAQSMNVDRIGDMKVSKFNKVNAKGNRKVAAISPSDATITEGDKTLMMQIAMGGMRQLMVSQAVLAKATTPQVRMLAQSEVEEQTGVSNKLKEIAAAKGVTLPASPDAETQALVARAGSLSGKELDMFYLNESGIKGHQLLQATMTTVSSTANSRSLRKLAMATMPVIRMHLEVSEDERENMGGGTAAR